MFFFKDEQNTYDVTLWRVRVTRRREAISITFYERVSVFLSYLSSMQSACALLYYHLCPPWLYRIFHKGHYFRKKKLLIMQRVFWLFLQALFEIFPILRKIHRDSDTKVYESTRYSCHILMEFEFSRQIFELSPSTKFNGNPSCGSREDEMFQADAWADMIKPNSRFSPYCERV